MATTRETRGQPDLTIVATLKALLDSGNVSRAADALGVTQPTVSQTLKRMREYFGDELFVRSGNVMRATPRALELRPLVERVMHDLDQMSDSDSRFDPRVSRREFLVCMADIAEYLVLPELVSVFVSEAPGCRLQTRRIPQEHLREALESGEVDLAMGALSGANRSLRQQRLGEYAAICMVGTDGRWGKSALTMEGYAGARHVVVERVSNSVDPIEQRLRERGVHRSISLSVHNYFAAARIVAETDLICTVPNVFMGQKLAAMFPVVLVPMPVKLGSFVSRLLWHNRYHADPGHVWLRRTFEQCVRKSIEWLPGP